MPERASRKAQEAEILRGINGNSFWMRDKQLAKCRPSTPLIVLATKRVVNRFCSENLKAGVFAWKRDAELALTAIVAPGTFLE
jgi:hypothetical protein